MLYERRRCLKYEGEKLSNTGAAVAFAALCPFLHVRQMNLTRLAAFLMSLYTNDIAFTLDHQAKTLLHSNVVLFIISDGPQTMSLLESFLRVVAVKSFKCRRWQCAVA